MRCVVIPMARSAASPASCARQSAQRRRSPSKQARAATTERAGPPDTTSTWSNASIAACARRPARSMPSWRGRTSSLRLRRARSSTTTRSACWRTAIAGSARSPRICSSTPPTGEPMIVTALFFYLFAGMCIASAVMVIASRNPVHSVLFLILTFFNASGLFLLLGAEFLAMILVVVYVGAVAVLFLFVVMMLDVDFAELRQGFLQYLPIGALVGVVFLAELLLVVVGWTIAPSISQSIAAPTPPIASVPNTEALGQVLYTRYIYFFQAAGVILLVAMIGAIVLTLRHKPNVKRQSISQQVGRTREEAIEVVKVRPGQGLS